MVQRILHIFNKEFSGLHQAAYLLGMFAFFSQILALVRDRLLAHFFGAGAVLDVYYASFRIPDFLYISIASFVSVTVLIPFLSEKISGSFGDTASEDAKKFMSDVFSVFMSVIILVSVIVFWLVPFLSDNLVPGFTEEQKNQFINITRILLLSPILLGVSSLFGSVTQTYRKFFIYAGAPVLYNVGIILGILFLMPFFGIYGVVLGVVFGALLHFLIQIPVVARHSLLPHFNFNIDWAQIKKVVYLSLPRTVALSSTHVTLIILFAIASYMNEGSISIFSLSFNLQSVPLSIIGVSYSIAAFPTLARLFSRGERKQFAEHITVAARHIIFWSIPAIVLFIVLRAQIVRTIYGSGLFDWTDTRLVAASLAVFSISVLANALQLLFVRGYYAAGHTKTPLLINVGSSALIVALSFMFVYIFDNFDMPLYFMESLLRIENVAGSVIISLPLAYSVGMIINGAALLVFFGRDFKEFSLSLEKAFVHSFAASIIMGFVAYKSLEFFVRFVDINTFVGIFTQGILSGTVGILAGIIILKILGNEEAEEIGIAIKKRFVGVSAIAPDKEDL